MKRPRTIEFGDLIDRNVHKAIVQPSTGEVWCSCGKRWTQQAHWEFVTSSLPTVAP